MQKSVKVRGLALLATVALLGGTAWIATATTGAYFSDTQSGAIGGTLGTIKVQVNGQPSGTNNTVDFASTLMPGVAQTVTVNYKNIGNNPQDVWITFPNATALSALNNLGHYGEVHVYDRNNAPVFESANLDDNTVRCADPALCMPLPKQLKVASNLAVGASGTVKFKFNYAGGLLNGSQGDAFNVYPAASGPYNATTNPNGQFFEATGVHGQGLPFAIVAEQVGIQP
jgi:hypothetical protein